MNATRPDADALVRHQDPGGAFAASPTYSQYPYCWLRDGAFIAHALDRDGRTAEAAAFHEWVARAVRGIDGRIDAALQARDQGKVPDHGRMPPARFRLDGTVEEGDWPNFQIDGYGQWLWSLGEHVRFGGIPSEAVRWAAERVAAYLEAFWDEPCFDAWEEGRTQQHTSTMASAWAGLESSGAWLDPRLKAVADTARNVILGRCVADGGFVKRVGSREVDASLLWLSTPFGLVEGSDVRIQATLARIERELVVDGGVHRYRADTFYGGGAWILLTASLAWHHARRGYLQRAARYLTWIERRRSADGGLPEQAPTSATDLWFLDYWTRRWGPSAHPLGWSHAMTFLARLELRSQRELRSA